jgi:hypothetical protein
MAWEAFMDYRLRAMYLSGVEVDNVQNMTNLIHHGDKVALPLRERDEMTKRELASFEDKVIQLGIGRESDRSED